MRMYWRINFVRREKLVIYLFLSSSSLSSMRFFEGWAAEGSFSVLDAAATAAAFSAADIDVWVTLKSLPLKLCVFR